MGFLTVVVSTHDRRSRVNNLQILQRASLDIRLTVTGSILAHPNEAALLEIVIVSVSRISPRSVQDSYSYMIDKVNF